MFSYLNREVCFIKKLTFVKYSQQNARMIASDVVVPWVYLVNDNNKYCIVCLFVANLQIRWLIININNKNLTNS